MWPESLFTIISRKLFVNNIGDVKLISIELMILVSDNSEKFLLKATAALFIFILILSNI